MLGLETEGFRDASLTRWTPVTAVTIHESMVTAVISIMCYPNVSANFADERLNFRCLA